MKLHTLFNKLLKYLFALFFALFACFAYAQECNVAKNDIYELRQNFINNTLPSTSNGTFFDLQEPTFFTNAGEEFHKHLLSKPISNVIFENNTQFKYFLEYLEKIEQNPCCFITDDNEDKKSIFYEDKDTTYRIFAYEKNDGLLHITLYIQEGNPKDIDNYDERSYIYSFKKEGNTFALLSINSAG